jgi:hypothetical protein
MDMRVKPAYEDLNLPFLSGELIDPRSLSRRKRGQDDRLVRAGIGGTGIRLHIRRPGLAGFRHCHRGRSRNSRYAHRNDPSPFRDCDEVETNAL